jgi:hypothetical protein
MKAFHELGLEIKARWRRSSFDEDAFPDIATEALASSSMVWQTSLDDVLSWVQSADQLPMQVNHSFGQPITVFYDPKFYIDVLTWIDGTTSIHEHAFSGAFGVLQGSSLHARYRFQAEQRYCERLFRGGTEIIDAELLDSGAVRPIHSGARSAHSLFHLDRPSVSIVVRTPRATLATPQLSYMKAGIAYDPHFVDMEYERLIRSLDIMREIDHPRFLDRARGLLDESSSFVAFKLAVYLSEHLDRDTFRTFLESNAWRHRELLAVFASHSDEELRIRNLINRRKTVRSRSHRFFLALLLNLDKPEDILRMVSSRYPEREPRDTVLTWVRELSMEPSTLPDEPNAIGTPFNDVAFYVMRLLLFGASDREVMHSMAREFDGIEDLESEIFDLCKSFRHSILFAPLFSAHERPTALT